MSKEYAIGIDLGTTFSCVGVFKNGAVEIIPNDQGNRITPSYVSFMDNERCIGDSARNLCTSNPSKTIYDAKRLIGRKFSDPVVQKDMLMWSFKVVDNNDKPMIEIDENTRFSAEEISAMVLSKLKETADAYLGCDVKNAVITVPAYFNDSQRSATKVAAEIAGLNVLRIINEPTASAMAYGLEKKKGQTILVFDYGGGTLDVSVLHIEDGVFKVLGISGDTHRGGEDIDNLLMVHFVKEFYNKTKKDISSSERAKRKLKSICEKTKIILSTLKQTNISVDALFDGIDFNSSITRSKFEDLCRNEFTKCMAPIDTALKDAKKTKDEIDEIVLVGGSTRIPKIQEMLREYFNGKELCHRVNPDEVVAAGASIQAAILSGSSDDMLKDIVLLDITPLSLGLKTAGDVMSKIVPRGTSIPVKMTQTFSTYSDNQTAVEINIYEGERTKATENNILGTFVVENLPPMPRGVLKIEVCFKIDADGILTVSCIERSKGVSKSIKINNKGRMTTDDIQKMIDTAEKYKKIDEEFKETSNAKNNLENYIFSIKSKINSGSGLTETQLKCMAEIISETLKWLDIPHQKDEYIQMKTKIEKVCDPILLKITE